MPYAADSTQAGYLGPTTDTLEGNTWEDFLQEVVVGITALDPTLVRPRWQQVPPNTPDVNTTWASVGIMDTEADWNPVNLHNGYPDPGNELLIRHEVVRFMASFYGPDAVMTADHLRDGLFIEQNRAALRANSVGIIEVEGVVRNADIFRQQFRDRVDITILFKRQVRRYYQVRNLVQAKGIIYGNDFGGRVVQAPIDTGDVSLETFWDPPTSRSTQAGTVWDDGLTRWDVL